MSESDHLRRVMKILEGTPLPPEVLAELDQLRATLHALARQVGVSPSSRTFKETWAVAGRHVGTILAAFGWTDEQVAQVLVFFWGSGLGPVAVESDEQADT